MKKPKATALPLAAMGVAALSSSCSSTATPPEHYNVLLIMSDDHARQMVGAYGGPIPTPGIDRVGAEGLVFDNGFVANSISGPSRACLLTGKHSHKNGFVSNEKSVFDGSQQTLPKLLQKEGYQTAIVGKWHLTSLPTGFDYWEIFPGQGDYYNPTFISMANDTVRQEGYATELVTKKGLDWLKNRRDPNKPFLLMVHHKAAHRNWLPRISDLELYEDKVFDLPETFWDDYQGRPAAARQEMSIRKDMDPVYDVKMDLPEVRTRLSGAHRYNISRLDSADLVRYKNFYTPLSEEYYAREMGDRERAEWNFQRYMRDYSKVIKPMDDGIGEIMDYLEETGLIDNTVVIYTSDQGFYMGEHGWFDKRFMYEESFCTPLLIHLPKSLKGRGRVSELVQNIDLAPTILDLAGAPIPSDIQGVSLLPLLRGERWQPARDCLYYHFYEYPAEHMVMRHYGVRDDRYKLIHFYNDQDFWELYDLKNDPSELHNVHDDPEYAAVREEMRRKLVEAQTLYEDTLALGLNGF